MKSRKGMQHTDINKDIQNTSCPKRTKVPDLQLTLEIWVKTWQRCGDKGNLGTLFVGTGCTNLQAGMSIKNKIPTKYPNFNIVTYESTKKSYNN